MTRRLLSCRNSRLTISRCLAFEFEDVIEACDEHVRIDSKSVHTQSFRRAAWRAGQTARMLVGGSKSTSGDELVFATGQVLVDVADHLAFQSLIRSASKSAVYLTELWLSDIPLRFDVRRMLAQFDHVFVGSVSTVDPLAEHLDRPVTYLAPSVDHDRFGSYPWPPTAIDVYAMGRRQPAVHNALLRWTSADPSRLYLFDTFAGNVPVADHRQHRAKLADLIRRSRYFVVNEAKFNQVHEAGSQSEIGYRFFEGAAAGAAMIGTEAHAPNFTQLFPWDEPLIVVDPSGDDVIDRIRELDDEPDRYAAIRRRNAVGSLRAHDPAHRWRQVLRTLGLEEPPGVEDRIRRLAERAEVIESADSAQW